MFSSQEFMDRFNISDNVYLGSLNKYFVDNLEEMEKILKLSKSKKFKEKNNMTAYEAISLFVFDKYGVSTTDGKPLSTHQVGDCLNKARKKRNAVAGVVKAVKTTAPLVAPPTQEKPVQAVVVAPVVAPGVSSVLTKQDYDEVAKKLKESGWNIKYYEEKAIYYFGLYETNNYKNISWNDELENLWVITQSRFNDAYDKMSDRYYFTIKGSLTYGVLAEFLLKNRPKQ